MLAVEIWVKHRQQISNSSQEQREHFSKDESLVPQDANTLLQCTTLLQISHEYDLKWAKGVECVSQALKGVDICKECQEDGYGRLPPLL